MEESIECLFSHQLEDGETLFDVPFAEDESHGAEESDDMYMTHASYYHQTPQTSRLSLLSSSFRSEAQIFLTDPMRDQHKHSLNHFNFSIPVIAIVSRVITG